MNKHRQLVVNLFAQILGFIVSMAISFFLTPFIVENVGREAYGFVGLANNFVEYAQVLVVALNSMASRFITISIFQNKNDDTNKYFSSVVFANIFISLVLILPMIWILMNLSNIVNVPLQIENDVLLLWLFIFLNFLISIIGSSFGVATFAKNRLDLSSMRMIESNLIKSLILIISFTFFKPAVWYIGFSSLIFTLYTTLFNVHYTRTLLPQIELSFKHFEVKKIQELLASGIWNSFNKMSSIMSSGLDLLIANLYIGASAMGLLSLSKSLPTIILTLFARISGVFSPTLTQSYAENNLEDMKKQLILSMKVLGLFSSIPMAGIFAYGHSFYQLWVPSQDPRMLYWLTVISSFAFVFALPMEGLWNIFTITNRVKQSSIFLFINSMLTILIVFFSVQLVSDANIRLFILAGVSTFFSVIRALTFLPMYGAYCLKLPIITFYPTILKNVVSVVTITLFSLFLSSILPIQSWFILLTLASITGVFGLLLNSYILLSSSEREFFLIKIRRRLQARFKGGQ
mgnify:CR=1 FL=1